MKKILYIFALISSLSFASCKGYLDINYNPNQATDGNVTTSMMMPAIEMNLAVTYGNFLRMVGGFYSQHYAHLNGTSNYVDYTRFTMSAVRSSNIEYLQLNQRVLSNIKTVQAKATADEDWATYLAATVLRAFTYQVLVDSYGELPYTEALNLEINQPKYDDGKLIYDGIIAELDAALESVSPSDLVCTNFLFPSNTTAAPWIQFANALKLKLLMRMADVSGADVQGQVAALVAENNFPTADISFAGCWSDQAGQYSPFYGEEFRPGAQQNLAANLAIIETMRVKDAQGDVVYQDPRLAAFFSTNSDNTYIGSVSGTNYPGTEEYTKWCRPIITATSPVYMITVSEVEFFLAEYFARWGSATEAAAHYAAAIEASFASAGVAGASDYVARYPYDNAQYKQILGVAKWVALSGTNSFEAWCEVRRLNYPAFGTATGSDFYNQDNDTYNASAYVYGTLYTPIWVDGDVGPGKLLERFPYAESSSSRNPNAPKADVAPSATTPVFWGK